MGQVYRAKDTRLGREVAIKVLPPGMADDPDRLKRFDREARALASMNHPHIAHIYGIERADDTNFLVMELAEGPTLKDLLSRGPLGLERSLELFEQIARALEAAHERGIIHRDLKPANIVVSPEHGVKILDFGLAKAFEPKPRDETSGTLTAGEPSGPTREGQILGTPAYMSPEQAKGESVDKRVDIWAFGCCFFEALIGRRPFHGETGTEVMASIIKDPPDLGELPSNVPRRIRELIEACLEKDPRLRLRDIGDAWTTIQKTLRGEDAEPEAAPAEKTGAKPGPYVLMTMGALAGIVLAAVFLPQFVSSPEIEETEAVRSVGLGELPGRGEARHLSMALDPAYPWAEWDGYPLAISPQGDAMVYCTYPDGSGERRLYLQPIGGREGRVLNGTEGAMNPFFSPDGRWVAFTARGKLMKVDLEGTSQPVALADAPVSFWGGDWGEDGYLYYVPVTGGGVFRVSQDGGEAEAVTVPNYKEGERGHGDPHLLPGGETLLITIPDFETIRNRIYAVSLEDKTMQPVVEGTRPVYLPSGHLVFNVAGTLHGVGFDPETLEVKGSPTPLLSGVQIVRSGRGAKFACSDEGTLAYIADPNAQGKLHWVDRAGRMEPLEISFSRSMQSLPSLSPDGEKLAAFDLLSPEDMEAWIADLKRGTVSRASFEGSSVAPVWSPDGERLYYALIDELEIRSYSIPRGEPGDYVLKLANLGMPYSVSPDGGTLALGVYYPFSTRWNILLHEVDGGGAPRPFVSTPAMETLAAFSPDGKWLAYNSDETGRFEVYARPVEGGGGKVQISAEGGNSPVWAPDGREIYYRSGSRMMAARLAEGEGMEVVGTETLFELQFETGSAFGPNYSVAADGERFLIPVSGNEPLTHHRIELVENWFGEIERLVAGS